MQASAEKIWSSAQEQLRSMLSVDTFNLWFAPLRAAGMEGDCVVLEVANDFCEVWLKDNYQGLLQDVLSIAAAKQLRAKFIVASGHNPAPAPALAAPAKKVESLAVPKPKPAPAPAHQDRVASNGEWNFNPKNTFETFVVGNNNNFAYAAAKAVAEAPGKSYNPLFLYGGVGLGKTHLLHAIGQHVAGTKKGARVGYVSSEKFTNEYIDAIQNNSLVKFRKKYRQTDVLLIDDIQFLAGKERIQEEFFHTFNALHEAHKQIVLTCDRPASEIQGLEHRLVSRFEWGLVTDLQPPDVETRIAILRKKSEDERISLPEDVIHFLANTMKNNIRELEGSLVRLGAYSSLTGQVITLDMAKNVLRDLIGDKKKIVSIEDIQEVVGAKYHVKIGELKSRRRSKTLVHPRQIAMYLSKVMTPRSLPEIGSNFGGRDHTTVLHAVRKIGSERQQLTELNQQLHVLEQTLKG